MTRCHRTDQHPCLLGNHLPRAAEPPLRFADIVHEVSRARRDWASEFLWQRGVGGAATDGQAKAAADEKHAHAIAMAEARYAIALSAIQHGYSIQAELIRHGLQEVSHAPSDPGDDTDQEPDLSNPDPEAATHDCRD